MVKTDFTNDIRRVLLPDQISSDVDNLVESFDSSFDPLDPVVRRSGILNHINKINAFGAEYLEIRVGKISERAGEIKVSDFFKFAPYPLQLGLVSHAVTRVKRTEVHVVRFNDLCPVDKPKALKIANHAFFEFFVLHFGNVVAGTVGDFATQNGPAFRNADRAEAGLKPCAMEDDAFIFEIKPVGILGEWVRPSGDNVNQFDVAEGQIATNV